MTEFINYCLLACLHYKCPRLDRGTWLATGGQGGFAALPSGRGGGTLPYHSPHSQKKPVMNGYKRQEEAYAAPCSRLVWVAEEKEDKIGACVWCGCMWETKAIYICCKSVEIIGQLCAMTGYRWRRKPMIPCQLTQTHLCKVEGYCDGI